MGFKFEFDSEDVFYWWEHDLKKLPEYLIQVKWYFKAPLIVLFIIQICNVAVIVSCAFLGYVFAGIGGCIRWIATQMMKGKKWLR